MYHRSRPLILLTCTLFCALVAAEPAAPSPEEIRATCEQSLKSLSGRKVSRSTYYINVYKHRNGIRLASQLGMRDLIQELAEHWQPVRETFEGESAKTGASLADGDRGALPTVFLALGTALDDQEWIDLGCRLADERFHAKGHDKAETAASWLASGEWHRGRPPRTSTDQCAITTAVFGSAFRHDPERFLAPLNLVIYKMTGTREHNYMPEVGLFRHDKDPSTTWGRGNGWYMVGLSEVLLLLPEDHPRYADLRAHHLAFSQGLLKHQRESGAWANVIDYPPAHDESSGTGMFLFGLTTGIQQGWYDDPAPYTAAVHKAWKWLAGSLDEKGRMQHVCPGTGGRKDAASYHALKLNHNDHGLLGFYWGALGYCRMLGVGAEQP